MTACARTARIEEELLERGLAPLLEHADACGACRAALLIEGVWTPGCVEPLLGHEVILQLDRLAAGKVDPKLRPHLEVCAACAAEVADAAEEKDEVDAPALARELEAPAPVVPVALACTFCHDRLARELASFCAACLAPHHAGCFQEHGRCAAPGCAETRWVRPQGPPRRSRRWILAALLASSVAAAGLVGLTSRGTAPSPDEERYRRDAQAHLEWLEADQRAREARREPAVARVGTRAITRSELEAACQRDPLWGQLLPDDGAGRRQVREEQLERLIEEALLELAGEAAPPAEPSEEEVARYWEEHPQRFTSGGRVRLRELVLLPGALDAPLPPLVAEWREEHPAWKPEELAADLLRRLRGGGTTFVDLVRGASMRAQPLELELDPLRDLIPPIPAALVSLEPGQVSDVVRSYMGTVHLFQLVSREGARLRPLEEVRPEVIALLRAGRAHAQRAERLRRARLAHPVEVPDLEAALSDPPEGKEAR